jgi:hypothetical protein
LLSALKRCRYGSARSLQAQHIEYFLMEGRMKRLSGLTKAANLSESMHRRLNMYTLAASAAGVSLLACSPPAEAKVIFTNTWIPITPTTATTNIDMTNDGVADFVISNHRIEKCSFSFCSYATMKVLPQHSHNEVWGNGSYAAALRSGVTVGSKGQFKPGHEVMAKATFDQGTEGSAYGSAGPWKQTTNRYLGVKFIIDGEVHFGWVRIDVAEAVGGIYAAVSGYAYETLPNKSIVTGQKSGTPNQLNKQNPDSASVDVPAAVRGSLGMLALGALGRPSSRYEPAK